MKRNRLFDPFAWWQMQQEMALAWVYFLDALNYFTKGLNRYGESFSAPYFTAARSLKREEFSKVWKTLPMETAEDYYSLFIFALQIFNKGYDASFNAVNKFHKIAGNDLVAAMVNTYYQNGNGEGIAEFWKRIRLLFKVLAEEYPLAIDAIGPHFGFHFEDGGYVKAGETDRFILYQVLPWKKCTEVRPDGKPVLIIPPYVLGASILGFLPGENKSYSHCFANQGIPTYIRIMKEINENPAVQVMTGEDDCIDMKHFCEIIRGRHGKPVTLNGFCQGGFVAALNLMSGELDGLVDAFITCVAPMDGSRSKALVEYLEHIPERFRDLGYAGKALPNGNKIVDGKVMSWVYKLKSMEREAPIFSYYRDLTMFNHTDLENIRITPTAAALNYWLIYERNDLPIGITQLSFDSFTKPVGKDGTLPVQLFGRPLNFNSLRKTLGNGNGNGNGNGSRINWLLCYADEDDLVDREAANAPTDFVEVEVSVFPKGHGAIATSWSLPTSECALHRKFKDGYRGPVRYQLDLDGYKGECPC